MSWSLFLAFLATGAFWLWLVGSTTGIDQGVIGLGVMLGLASFTFWLTLKVPDNLVSWTLMTAVVFTVINQVAYDYYFNAIALGLPGGAVAFVIHNVLLWLSLLLVFLVPLIFPTGRPPTRRWNLVAWVAAIAVLPMVVKPFYLAFTIPLEVLEDGDTGIGWADLLVTLGQAAIVVFALASLVSLIVRFIRSQGVERKQILYVIAPLTFLVSFWVIESIWTGSPLALILLALGGVTLPIGIGLAIVKFRLYEIDRIISRTVSYALVAGLLVAVFSGVVTFTTSLLQVESDLAVAASTLAVAALFNPLRKRIQSWVDRRFNRSRYDAERVMDEFTGTLQDRVDPDGVVDGWVHVVTETMQPSAVSVWVREGAP